MTQETKQEQAPTPAENPAVSTGMAQPSQDCADRKKSVVELTDADLQAVNGGGGRGGLGGEV